jgi:hypothetical protein
VSAEYDEFRARVAADAGGRKPTDAGVQEMLAANRRLIEAEWRALGFAPVPNGDGTLSAPSTLKSVGRWPPVVKKAAPDDPWPDDDPPL